MIKKEIKKFIDNKEVFFSLEFFPPKNEESLNKLNNSFDKLKDFNILFSDVTCGAGGSTKDGSLSLAKKVKEIKKIPCLKSAIWKVYNKKIVNPKDAILLFCHKIIGIIVNT